MIYDNGALMVGNIDLIIEEIEKEIEIYLDMAAIDIESLLKDLYDLKKSNIEIVCINYDNGMNYSIDCWTKNEKIEVGEWFKWQK